MFFLTCTCVLISALAAKSPHGRHQATLDKENNHDHSEEIKSIIEMYQQYEDKYQKELQEANRLQADLYSASSPFYQSLLEMLPPTPPYPMNGKPM